MNHWFLFSIAMTVGLWVVAPAQSSTEVKLASVYGQALAESTQGDLVEGVVTQVCVKKGCWMKVKTASNEERFVRFKDYGFFVPTKGLVGKTVKLRALSVDKEVSVKEQKHFLEDAGASKDEISKVTQDITRKEWLASGVEIQN